MSPEGVVLEAPAGEEWTPVIRLVLGGIGDRLDLGFDQLDDLQLAVEHLLAEASPSGSVRLAFEMGDHSLRARIGPLREASIADALQTSHHSSREFGLRRVLETVVDSFGVEEAGGGELVVRLEKRLPEGSS